MPTTVLIAPDQRLLGSALSDLTLYGAQPTAVETQARADGSTPVSPPALLAIPVPSEAISHGASSSVAIPSLVVADSPTAATALTLMALHGAPMTALTPAVAPAAASIGAGSFSVQPLTVGLHGASPVEALTAFEPIATAPASVAAAHAITTDVLPVNFPVVEQSTSSVDHLTNALQPVLPTALEAASPAVDHLAGAVQPVVGTILDAAPAFTDHLTDALASAAAIEPIASTALDGAAPITDHLADALAPTVAPIVETPAAAAASVTTAADAVGASVAPVTAGLFGLAGSDPAAGIHTLVGMVQTADAFDLSHATSPEAAPAPSIVDALSADEAPSSLLGDAHHDLAGIGHLTDTHAAHLGL